MMLPPTPRVLVLREIVAEVRALTPGGRVVVAVDGGGGTSGFADDLAVVFRESGVDTHRASVGDFHHSRSERTLFGPETPERFYRDAFDYSTLQRVLLDPFRMAGSAGFQTTAWDVRRDAPTLTRWVTGQSDGVLIVDGVFLLRPELRGIWNYSILLEVPWDVAYGRLAERDARNPDPDALANARYRDGQELYFTEANPREYANALVDNADPAHPRRIFADSC